MDFLFIFSWTLLEFSKVVVVVVSELFSTFLLLKDLQKEILIVDKIFASKFEMMSFLDIFSFLENNC